MYVEGTNQSNSSINETTHNLPPTVSRVIDEAVFSFQEPQQVLELILDTALHLCGAEYGSLRWVNRQTNKLILKAIRLRSGSPSSIEDWPDLDLNGRNIVSQVAKTKEPLLIPDLSLFSTLYHN